MKEECIVPFKKTEATLNCYRSKTFLEVLNMKIRNRSKAGLTFVRSVSSPEEIAETNFYATPYTYVQIINSQRSDTFMSHCMSLVDD